MTVQGPVKKQQPDGMSHRGAGPPPPLTLKRSPGADRYAKGGGRAPAPPLHLVNGMGNSPVSGTASPRSSQTGQVIWGLL